jgi:hypothetical protein
VQFSDFVLENPKFMATTRRWAANDWDYLLNLAVDGTVASLESRATEGRKIHVAGHHRN